MTRVQIHFRLQRPLDELLLTRLSDTYVRYGIQQLKVDPSLDGLMVEYDATRLRPAEVEATLARCGIAVLPA